MTQVGGGWAAAVQDDVRLALGHQMDLRAVVAVIDNWRPLEAVTALARVYLTRMGALPDEQMEGELTDAQSQLGEAIMADSAVDDGEPPAASDGDREPPGLSEGVREMLGMSAVTETGLGGAGGLFSLPRDDRTPPAHVLMAPVFLSQRLLSPALGPVTSAFGFREHPVSGESDFHTGIDIAADQGADVCAALQGTVLETGRSAIYGNYIVLDHGGGVTTSYSHLKSIVAKPNARVSQGARIATVGNTGISTGPHLHFELMVDGLKADPLPHLRILVVGD